MAEESSVVGTEMDVHAGYAISIWILLESFLFTDARNIKIICPAELFLWRNLGFYIFNLIKKSNFDINWQYWNYRIISKNNSNTEPNFCLT